MSRPAVVFAAGEEGGLDHAFMARALQLAGRAVGLADPNPAVGGVIVAGGRIIGEGWTQAPGGAHAEIMALRDAARRSPGQAAGADAYVTLEPCSHHGRTPPCADALIEAGIRRVAFATRDPNPEVDGGGMGRLEAACIQTDIGMLGPAAEALNRGFFKRMRSGLPWVRLKSAQSLDGRTALPNGESQWISSDASRRDVQNWRVRSSAILTGIGTVLDDDPSMTVRIGSVVRQPIRVVVDSRFRIPPGSRILRQDGRTVVAGLESAEVPAALRETGAEVLTLPADASGRGVDLDLLLRRLANLEINEIQVEAGSRLCGSLLQGGWVDELLIYQAPVLLGDGGPPAIELGRLERMSDRVSFEVVESRAIGTDLRLRLLPAHHSTRAG